MTHEMSLFDESRFRDTTCPSCGAVRLAGQEKAPGCVYDRAFDRGGLLEAGSRPLDCPNRYDPALAEIPY